MIVEFDREAKDTAMKRTTLTKLGEKITLEEGIYIGYYNLQYICDGITKSAIVVAENQDKAINTLKNDFKHIGKEINVLV